MGFRWGPGMDSASFSAFSLSSMMRMTLNQLRNVVESSSTSEHRGTKSGSRARWRSTVGLLLFVLATMLLADSRALAQEADVPLHTRPAFVATTNGGVIPVHLPDFVPPEALGVEGRVEDPDGTLLVSGLGARLIARNSVLPHRVHRVETWEGILKALWVRTDELGATQERERIERLRLAVGGTSMMSDLTTAAGDLARESSSLFASHLSTSFSLVSGVLDVSLALEEVEAEALALHTGFHASALSRKDVFQTLLSMADFRDPALVSAVTNSGRDLDRFHREDLETIRREFMVQAGLERGTEATARLLVGTVLGHGAVLAFGGTLAMPAAIASVFLYELDRFTTRQQIEALIILGATLESQVLRPPLAAGALDPEVELRAREMRDILLQVLSDAARRYAGPASADPVEMQAGPWRGLLDPNSTSPTEGLSHREYMARAHDFRSRVSIPDPRRSHLAMGLLKPDPTHDGLGISADVLLFRQGAGEVTVRSDTLARPVVMVGPDGDLIAPWGSQQGAGSGYCFHPSPPFTQIPVGTKLDGIPAISPTSDRFERTHIEAFHDPRDDLHLLTGVPRTGQVTSFRVPGLAGEFEPFFLWTGTSDIADNTARTLSTGELERYLNLSAEIEKFIGSVGERIVVEVQTALHIPGRVEDLVVLELRGYLPSGQRTASDGTSAGWLYGDWRWHSVHSLAEGRQSALPFDASRPSIEGTPFDPSGTATDGESGVLHRKFRGAFDLTGDGQLELLFSVRGYLWRGWEILSESPSGQWDSIYLESTHSTCS